jgi:hypothetical protein
LEAYARTVKATKTISERLSSVVCAHCDTANQVGAPTCESCGAPMGEVQPVACHICGNVMPPKSKFCASCGAALVV